MLHTAVADTWALSIGLADAATDGVAGILLQLAALLDPNGIPHWLFTTAAVTGYCTIRTGNMAQPVTDDDTHDALRALHRLSLTTTTTTTADPADTDAGTVRVHALLQRVVRENTPPSTNTTWP
ncbi:hypothetical protein AB0J72_23915 [Dactylosporangium sp. NPDC049742]|uniref:DUF7779 domain-containing protein n=1 Tax=Dactylosporangium sp. NPDC049742 TaxID=3154737 RepID=UPI003446AB21